MATIKENKVNEGYNVKSPLDYIEEKLQDADIDYTVEQAMDDRPYDTWITINDGQDSLADEIICSVVGYAYEWVRDKYGNRKYCKVVTDEDTIQELNESLKGNHSFKGLTKKVVEAKDPREYSKVKDESDVARRIRERTENFTKPFSGNIVVDESELEEAKALLNKYYCDVDYVKLRQGDYCYLPHPSGKRSNQYEIYGDTLRHDIKESKDDLTKYMVRTESGVFHLNAKNDKEALKQARLIQDEPVERIVNTTTNKVVFNLEENLNEDVQTLNAKVYYEEDGEPIIVFKSIANRRGDFDAYVHNGQHTTASKEYVKTLKKANLNDQKVKDLIAEYESNYPVKLNLKESWIQFTFEDGSNPYVAKTKEEQDRMFKKYKDRVEQVSDITYLVKSDKKKTNEGLEEDKSEDDWLQPMFLCDRLEQQSFISFAYEDQDGSVVATTSWETTPRRAHSDYIKTRELLDDNYSINVLKQETRDNNKEFAYKMRITPKEQKVNEADDSYFSSKPNNDIKIKKFVKEYADEIKKDIDNETYDDYGMWSHYLDMFTMDFPKNKLTTSEFAIKFFNEINKRFGSDFHYGYVKENLQEAKGKLDSALPELEKYVKEYKDKIVDYGQALAKGEVIRPNYKDFTTRLAFDVYYFFKNRGLDLSKYMDENDLRDDYIATLMKKALTNCGVKITKDDYLNESLDTFNDKMDFLAKDEDEAIDGYKKVIKTVDNKNVKAQLKKIETEEKAHKDYLERVKKNKDIKYTEPLDEE